jgi:Holliday junction DNA helicase RuvA
MIGKIKGNLIEIDGNEGLIETSTGISYMVYLPAALLSHILPHTVDIYTYLQIREDQHVLYGFDTKEQYKMFQMLLSVDGVGPKTAHGVVSKMGVGDIVKSVQNKDVESFTKVPGLGKKTAQKILLELSSKLKTELDIGSIIEVTVDTDALAALVSLGYRANEAREMLKSVDAQLPVEIQVRSALQKK